MKKVLVVFILLMLVVPAMATITVTATCTGTGANATVTVSYATTGETLPPRAFGLLISCDASGTIGTVAPVTTNYYVAPGTFSYDGTVVTTWGNPVVPVTVGKSFILEVGSLYASNDAQHPTAPPLSGTLLTFPLTVPTGTSVVSIALDAARGGVVREDPLVTGNVTLTGCSYTNGGGVIPCFPSDASYAKQFSDWKAYKSYQPSWDGACWCANSTWKYQCSGDAEGKTETLSKFRVYTNDYKLVMANWSKKISDVTINPCADIDHKSETLSKFRVYTNDYKRVMANWAKKDSQLLGDCPRPDAQNP